jgi:uncharacterized membrane protein
MNRRTAISVAVIAAAVALVALPAMATKPERTATEASPAQAYPAKWVDQGAEELRVLIDERAAIAAGRISESRRLTDEQKDEALANLSDALEAIAAVDEPAEIVGTAISRRQLQRMEWRAIRRAAAPDLDSHVARDLAGDSRRFEHLTTIVGWAASAGEDVAAVTEFLEAASASLEAASGNGPVVERHDAVHIARAWMTKAHTNLIAGS